MGRCGNQQFGAFKVRTDAFRRREHRSSSGLFERAAGQRQAQRTPQFVIGFNRCGQIDRTRQLHIIELGKLEQHAEIGGATVVGRNLRNLVEQRIDATTRVDACSTRLGVQPGTAEHFRQSCRKPLLCRCIHRRVDAINAIARLDNAVGAGNAQLAGHAVVRVADLEHAVTGETDDTRLVFGKLWCAFGLDLQRASRLVETGAHGRGTEQAVAIPDLDRVAVALAGFHGDRNRRNGERGSNGDADQGATEMGESGGRGHGAFLQESLHACKHAVCGFSHRNREGGCARQQMFKAFGETLGERHGCAGATRRFGIAGPFRQLMQAALGVARERMCGEQCDRDCIKPAP